ncbi:MAG: CDP-alcohol phosphatidyltransferase family protein [Gammaproteobacteria bacterium]
MEESRARRKGVYLLPNLITTGALFAGFSAVVAAMDGNFITAAVAIYIAMVLDGLDGRVARMTSTESEFGKQYDSLADMVSFGLAPALVFYLWGAEHLEELGWLWGKLGWLVAFFFAVAAALRLARYNSRQGSADKRYFEGLPSPSAAAVVAGLVWLSTVLEASGVLAMITGLAVTAGAGALMVSRLAYYSGKDFNLGGRVPFAYVLLIPAVFILISLNPPTVLFLLFFTYALSAPALSLWRLLRRRRRRLQRDDETLADD